MFASKIMRELRKNPLMAEEPNPAAHHQDRRTRREFIPYSLPRLTPEDMVAQSRAFFEEMKGQEGAPACFPKTPFRLRLSETALTRHARHRLEPTSSHGRFVW